MDKEVVVHILNGIYSAIKRNIFESVLMRWMSLELIIHPSPPPPRAPSAAARGGQKRGKRGNL